MDAPGWQRHAVTGWFLSLCGNDQEFVRTDQPAHRVTRTKWIAGQPASDNWKANGINVSAVGTWPLANQFSLLGKLGFTRWSVDDKFSVGGLSGAAKEDGIDLSLGIGAQYAFAKQWAGRAEYEVFKNVGKDTTGKSDIDVLSIGVVYKF